MDLDRDGDEPAVIWPDGHKVWYKEGMEHREGGKPAIITAFGRKEWFKEGERYFPE